MLYLSHFTYDSAAEALRLRYACSILHMILLQMPFVYVMPVAFHI